FQVDWLGIYVKCAFVAPQPAIPAANKGMDVNRLIFGQKHRYRLFRPMPTRALRMPGQCLPLRLARQWAQMCRERQDKGTPVQRFAQRRRSPNRNPVMPKPVVERLDRAGRAQPEVLWTFAEQDQCRKTGCLADLRGK